MIVNDALNIAYTYFSKKGTNNMQAVSKEFTLLTDSVHVFSAVTGQKNSYDAVQERLSKINEKETVRKDKGVYYTPKDVVRFILNNTINAAFERLTPRSIGRKSLRHIPYSEFCFETSVFDPTCGTGEFLLECLTIKFELLEKNRKCISGKDIETILSTIHGNDINSESTAVTKIRLLLCAVRRYGINKCSGLAAVLNKNFTAYDFVADIERKNRRYDMIIGNPPYVEDSKSSSKPKVQYGNIYANVLKNAMDMLSDQGSMGFVIPLSYISTPRMRKIKEEMGTTLTTQFILSYADRPDSLFESVHQKLCIFFGKKSGEEQAVYTGNYRYWYKDERSGLFVKPQVIKNRFMTNDGIPKLGTRMECSIYRKILTPANRASVYEMSRQGEERVYLNRRETFWMKAYRAAVPDPEYKVFSYQTAAEADYGYCLIHSSLFWWYWIAVSDCWHVSKTLNGFKTPILENYDRAVILAGNLSDRLEETKVYVGTKQTEYEYKHKDCMEEIWAIDDYINEVYGLSAEESQYIKNFALKYRTSGGMEQNEGA